MQLCETLVTGVLLVDIDPQKDERGFFARTWDSESAKKHGILERFDYSCISRNTEKHTLRGMHYQRFPHGETKLVRCTKGRIFDVILDLRPDSKTYKKWVVEELSDANHRALYIPSGCAHGFLSLEPETEVLYHIAGAYTPDAAAGVRWDDPAFAIPWPTIAKEVSERDRMFPLFR